uniref:Uncharacterized protein n=1 Tax=Pithovirus LCPAC406 TaxID=2506599 RepID=A0A481ZF63_9VIRU|nr:MAG: hypothetical protein LCPAC406_02890 [Pithovirus LCPAC406]
MTLLEDDRFMTVLDMKEQLDGNQMKLKKGTKLIIRMRKRDVFACLRDCMNCKLCGRCDMCERYYPGTSSTTPCGIVMEELCECPDSNKDDVTKECHCIVLSEIKAEDIQHLCWISSFGISSCIRVQGNDFNDVKWLEAESYEFKIVKN